MGARPFAYQPALDGLRAVSIAVVLAFHLGAPVLPGGYLGVSTFFTLSGFLITSLLLDERTRTGGIAVRAFYVRRLRRLLPASLLVLLLVAVAAATGLVAARTDLRTGMLAALGQVANWEALLGGRSYADLFVAPSPVEHFWSLAIEEQFYWLWPVAILGVTALGPRRVAPVLVGLFGVLGVGAVLTAQLWSGDAAYFASWARFAEIVAGAALAAVLAGRTLPAAARHLAGPCLAAIVVLAVVTPSGRGWAYEGGLPLFSLLTAGLIAGVQVDGPVQRLLSARPLVATGLVSYGLYLFHWPVFTVLDADRTGLDGVALAAIRLAVTVALTVASYRWVERPVRTGRVLRPAASYVRSVGIAVPALAGAVLLLVPVLEAPQATPTAEPVVLGPAGSSLVSSALAAEPAPFPVPSADDLSAWAAATTGDPGPSASLSLAAPPPRLDTTPLVEVDAASPAVPTVAFFGDSIADWLLIRAAPTFRRQDVTVIDAAQAACDGAVELPEGRDRHLRTLALPADCREWPESYAQVLEDPSRPVDVAVLVLGQAPTVDRFVDGRWQGPCDGTGWYTDDVADRIRYARRQARDVVFVLPAYGGARATWGLPDDHRQRIGCIRRDLRDLVDGMDVRTVDLNAVLCPDAPDGACLDRHEADGTHVDPEDSAFVLDWLLDEVLRPPGVPIRLAAPVRLLPQ